MFTYILTPPLGANFFPKKSLHLERPTSLFFGPSVKFCRFFFDGVPYSTVLPPLSRTFPNYLNIKVFY